MNYIRLIELYVLVCGLYVHVFFILKESVVLSSIFNGVTSNHVRLEICGLKDEDASTKIKLVW